MEAAERTDPLDAVAAILARQAALADRLEAFADALPNPQPEECRVLARDLPASLESLHAIEERCFLSILGPRLPASSPLAPSLRRMREEHVEDRDAALELAEILETMADHPSRIEPETLGYQLRALFVALRRHHAFDAEALIPEARARLAPNDLDRLSAALRDEVRTGEA